MSSNKLPFEDFGDLLVRLVPPSEPSARQIRPVVASAVEVDGDGPLCAPPLWIIVHSVTKSGLRLIHARDFETKKLAVRIESSTGEIVRVLLDIAWTEPLGELFESTAQFAS